MPEMTTQEMLDHLADNDILTSVVYGPREEGTTDDRYFSVTIFLRASRRVFSPPTQAKSFEEAIQNAHEMASELEWIK